MGFLDSTAGNAIGNVAGQLIGQRLAEMMRQDAPGSPRFEFSNTGTIAANASETINFEDRNRKATKWLPFNLNVITNADATNAVDVYLNQMDAIRISEGSERVIFESLRSIKIVNVGSTTISAGSIVLSCAKRGGV